MLIPEVVGFELTGSMVKGTTGTDLVLNVVEMLRAKGVVGKFVEFYGEGLDRPPLADRATITNMAPEYGATCGFFPIDGETLRYLRHTGREHVGPLCDDRRGACRATSAYFGSEPQALGQDVARTGFAGGVGIS